MIDDSEDRPPLEATLDKQPLRTCPRCRAMFRPEKPDAYHCRKCQSMLDGAQEDKLPYAPLKRYDNDSLATRAVGGSEDDGRRGRKIRIIR